MLSSELERYLKSQGRKETTGVSISNHPNGKKNQNPKPPKYSCNRKNKGWGGETTQPQTLRLQISICSIQADSKGGEDGVQQCHTVTPGLQLLGVPSLSPSQGWATPRAGDQEPPAPDTTCHHLVPPPGHCPSVLSCLHVLLGGLGEGAEVLPAQGCQEHGTGQVDGGVVVAGGHGAAGQAHGADGGDDLLRLVG